MKHKNLSHQLLPLVAVILSFLLACNDPTFVGADLVEEDAINVEFTDKIAVRTSTVRSDSALVYGPVTTNSDERLRTYLVGNFQDPYFGRTSAEIYAQVGIQFAKPNFSNLTLDSIVLVLPYDTSATYGITNQNYRFEVLRVTEQMNAQGRYYSDQTFMTDPTPLGSIETTLQPLKVDSILYYNTSGSPVKRGVRQLRIPLTDAFAQELIGLDTAVYSTDSTFTNYLAGVNIRTTTTNAGIVGFNLLSTISSSDPGGIFLYYHKGDTLRQFVYPFSSVNSQRAKVVHLEHDYTNAPVQPFIGDLDLGDSLVFIQAAAGLNAKVDFPDLSDYQGLVVNKAVLEFTVADLSTDGADVYPPLQQLVGLYRGSSGSLFVLPEITNAILNAKDFARSFGGTVTRTKDGTGWLYRINISTHFQNMLDGIVPATIYLQAYPSAERASRVGLYGGGTAEATRPKLQLTFTRL